MNELKAIQCIPSQQEQYQLEHLCHTLSPQQLSQGSYQITNKQNKNTVLFKKANDRTFKPEMREWKQTL
jgi:hypothetical protein